MIININAFKFAFFLSNMIKVRTLEYGAKKYGGATKTKDFCYSNIAKNNYIEVDEYYNKLSIFIPSTFNTDKKIDNKAYVKYAKNYINNNFNTKNLIHYSTEGSWYSDDLQKVILENITIISFEVDKVTEVDIKLMQKLANIIKQKMNQEAVTITINGSMAIV